MWNASAGTWAAACDGATAGTASASAKSNASGRRRTMRGPPRSWFLKSDLTIVPRPALYFGRWLRLLSRPQLEAIRVGLVRGLGFPVVGFLKLFAGEPRSIEA